jgi:divalent metal cation (Fe/Co/Zn/Cd) transporter
MDQKPKAILVAMGGKLIIRASKFTAAFLRASAATLAEGIHSVVDTGEGALRLYGLHRSTSLPMTRIRLVTARNTTSGPLE